MLRSKLTVLAVVTSVASSCSDKNQFAENSFIGKIRGTSVGAGDTHRKSASETTSATQKTSAAGEGIGSTSGADAGASSASGATTAPSSGTTSESGSGAGTASGSDANSGSGSGSGPGSTSDSGSKSGSTDGRVEIVAGGLAGGHFDFDSYSQVNQSTGFALLVKEKRTHTHANDDEFGVTGADFFDLKDDHVSVSNTAAANARFAIVVIYAGLFNKAVLNINGKAVSVVDYENSLAAGNVPVFTIGVGGLQKTCKIGLEARFNRVSFVSLKL